MTEPTEEKMKKRLQPPVPVRHAMRPYLAIRPSGPVQAAFFDRRLRGFVDELPDVAHEAIELMVLEVRQSTVKVQLQVQ